MNGTAIGVAARAAIETDGGLKVQSPRRWRIQCSLCLFRASCNGIVGTGLAPLEAMYLRGTKAGTPALVLSPRKRRHYGKLRQSKKSCKAPAGKCALSRTRQRLFMMSADNAGNRLDCGEFVGTPQADA